MKAAAALIMLAVAAPPGGAAPCAPDTPDPWRRARSHGAHERSRWIGGTL